MRGKGWLIFVDDIFDGITPAHAGKRDSGVCLNLCYEDHPRTCGEKPTARFIQTVQLGSPPHMRGKEFLNLMLLDFDRITPAHAGKRDSGVCLNLCYEDHPRTCGEKHQSSFKLFLRLGSPPHMRGKVMMNVMKRAWERITPAHAGKSIKKG